MKLCLKLLTISSFALAACQQPAGQEDPSESSGQDIVSSRQCDSIDVACQAEAKDTSRLSAAMSDALGVGVKCKTSSGLDRIKTASGGYYYGAAVRCTTSKTPSAAAAAGFTSAMESKGFYGVSLVSGVIVAQSTSRECRLPSGDVACRAASQDTTRLESLVWASLGTSVKCETGAARRIDDGAQYYYLADVTCTPESTPKPADVAAYAARMSAFGMNGYELGADGTIHGTQTTRLCNTY